MGLATGYILVFLSRKTRFGTIQLLTGVPNSYIHIYHTPGDMNCGPEVTERARELVKRTFTSLQPLFVLGLSSLPNVGSHSCSPCPLPQADVPSHMGPPSWAPYSPPSYWHLEVVG